MARDDRRTVITLRIPAPSEDEAARLNVIGTLGADLLGRSPSVFLVDDDARLRTVVRELLEDEGITVVGEAGSAGAALDALAGAGGQPLVALVDVRMPGLLNGIDLTRVLARSAAGVRVVVFTGFLEPGIEQAARDAGAVSVLHKGTRAAELVAAIQRAWAGVTAGR